MLYLVGLGLSDEKDITVRGLEVVKAAERVYLEAYTSILLVDKERLEKFYGRPVIVADREMVESKSDEILADADKVDVAFLVVGDPFGATTHADMVLRARELGIAARSVPNASILNAVGVTGLQLYNFGQTVSMVFFTDSWRPASFYDRLAENAALGLHSLILLDIKVREPDLAAMARGRIVYEPPRFMTAAQCAAQMLEVEQARRAGICRPDSLAVAVARVGSDEQRIVAGTLAQLAATATATATATDLGPPLHSLVLVGKTHDLERDFVREYAVDRASFDAAWERQQERQQQKRQQQQQQQQQQQNASS